MEVAQLMFKSSRTNLDLGGEVCSIVSVDGWVNYNQNLYTLPRGKLPSMMCRIVQQ